MANLQECLKYAVGLSPKDCNCFTADRPATYNRSDSGFFLDDPLEGIPLVYPASLEDCDGGSVWDILEQARIQGIANFHTGFLANSLRHADAAIVPSRGQIGDDKNNNHFYITNPVCGIVLKPKPLQGGAMNLNSVSLTMAGIATITLKIFGSDDMVTPKEEIVFNTQNNKKITHTLSSPLSLPFTADNGTQLKYYFVYERTGNILPRDNVFNCGCGSVRGNWDPYVEGRGFSLLGWNDLNNQVDGYDGYTYGIQLDASFSCDAAKWMCINPFDYQVDAYSRVIAKVIQLESINKLISGILTSPAINRFTVMPKDGLITKMTQNQHMIEGQYNWLGREMMKYASNMTDCFTCKAGNVFTKQSLLI